MTRFLVALIGGAFIFVTVWYLCGLVLLWLAPPWAYMEVSYKSISGSLSSVIAVSSGALAAMVVFLALLIGKVGGAPAGTTGGRAHGQRRQPEMQQETNLLHRLS